MVGLGLNIWSSHAKVKVIFYQNNTMDFTLLQYALYHIHSSIGNKEGKRKARNKDRLVLSVKLSQMSTSLCGLSHEFMWCFLCRRRETARDAWMQAAAVTEPLRRKLSWEAPALLQSTLRGRGAGEWGLGRMGDQIGRRMRKLATMGKSTTYTDTTSHPVFPQRTTHVNEQRGLPFLYGCTDVHMAK